MRITPPLVGFIDLFKKVFSHQSCAQEFKSNSQQVASIHVWVFLSRGKATGSLARHWLGFDVFVFFYLAEENIKAPWWLVDSGLPNEVD